MRLDAGACEAHAAARDAGAGGRAVDRRTLRIEQDRAVRPAAPDEDGIEPGQGGAGEGQMRLDPLDATLRRELDPPGDAAACQIEPPGETTRIRAQAAFGMRAGHGEIGDFDHRRRARTRMDIAVCLERAHGRSAPGAEAEAIGYRIEIERHLRQPERVDRMIE